EACADRDRGLGIEAIGLVDLRHVAVARLEGGHEHVGIDAERLSERDLAVRFQGDERIGGGVERRGHGHPPSALARAAQHARGAGWIIRPGPVAYSADKSTSTLPRVALE